MTTKQDLDSIKQSCAIAAQTLLHVGDNLVFCKTTEDIDVLVKDFIEKNNAYPSPLNYKSFPKHVCTSRNEVMCHGIPTSKEKLLDGDIINVDVTTYYPIINGCHGDTSATFFVGSPSSRAKRIVEIARQALLLGIEEVKPGVRINNIGTAIEKFVKKNGYVVAKEFVGHGVGKKFHDEPTVLHFNSKVLGPILEPGMVFTIEPIINECSSKYIVSEDGWTILSADKKLSAQFEHTVLVTEEGHEVLTGRDRPLKWSEI